jgi:hypothetical protein
MQFLTVKINLNRFRRRRVKTSWEIEVNIIDIRGIKIDLKAFKIKDCIFHEKW